MTYQRFAYLYDQLMEDAPYEEWFQFFHKTIQKYQPSTKTVLDVGCGTGAMLVELVNNGFEPTGIDLSSDMLTIANEKLLQLGKQVPLFEQDMRRLDNIGSFDAIIVFCDSLNYLETEEDIAAAFSSFYRLLNKEGLLLFDVHSTYKIDKVFIGATFAEEEENISYIWKSYEGAYRHSVEHDLTFFIKTETGLYERYTELHKQRTYPVEYYEQHLKENGFQLLNISANFHLDEPILEKSERIFFVAKKLEGKSKEVTE